MDYYAGIDVSLECSSVCVVDGRGKIVRSAPLAPSPPSLPVRPVVFELMPATFTSLQLQRTVEALAGRLVHKPNFRRLVEQQDLVEETGEAMSDTGGASSEALPLSPDGSGGKNCRRDEIATFPRLTFLMLKVSISYIILI